MQNLIEVLFSLVLGMFSGALLNLGSSEPKYSNRKSVFALYC